MKRIQRVKTFILAFSFSIASLAQAVEIRPYTAEALEAAKASGKTVVVGLHADWCSTCKAQEAAFRALRTEPSFKNVIVLKADFDREKGLRKALGVAKQSTLVVYRKGQEVARATGTTDKEDIAQLVAQGG